MSHRILTISTAADMDLNGNGRIDCGTDEAASLKQWFNLPQFLYEWCFLDRLANAFYQISGRTGYRFKVTWRWCLFLPCIEITNLNWHPEIRNDVFIPPSRARGPGEYAIRSIRLGPYVGAQGRTHANIANAGVAEEIVPYLIQRDQLYGDLRPFGRVSQACP